MKKIKSIKLKTDCVIVPNLYYNPNDRFWYLNDLKWSDENIRSGRLDDLFYIEYEEGRKYIDVRFEYDEMYEKYPLTMQGIRDAVTKQFNDSYNFQVTETGRGTL